VSVEVVRVVRFLSEVGVCATGSRWKCWGEAGKRGGAFAALAVLDCELLARFASRSKGKGRYLVSMDDG
jgi:hypothetical protein